MRPRRTGSGRASWPGAWLAETLAELRGAGGEAAGGSRARRSTPTLRPYQREGVRWLWLLSRLGLGGCLADDMGLGKTVQVLALLLLLEKHRRHPAARTCSSSPRRSSRTGRPRPSGSRPSLRVLVAHPSAMPREELDALGPEALAGHDVVVVSYGAVHRSSWLAASSFGLVVLDEAQAIKNPAARQTRAVKALRSRVRLALTGTPVENRAGDLWSIFDFVNPGLLGSAKEFGAFLKRAGRPAHPTARRLTARCHLAVRRAPRAGPALHPAPAQDRPRRHRRPAGQDGGEGVLRAHEAAGGALPGVGRVARPRAREREPRGPHAAARARPLVPPAAQAESATTRRSGSATARTRPPTAASSRGSRRSPRWSPRDRRRSLVFTQFREMTAPLARFLGEAFGRPGLVLSGETKVRERAELVRRFQEDEAIPFFVLSLKAGGTGLNLTAATHVIHFDRWWNPAVEDQATDRAFRIGQRRGVLVHKLVCRGTVEERIDVMLEDKRKLSRDLLDGGDEVRLTELDDRELLRLVSLDLRSATADT